MRWRLYIFIMSATAAFCFMLMTAVTDYGRGGGDDRGTPLMSAAVQATTGMASALVAVPAPAAKPVQKVVEQAATPDALPRPVLSRVFVPAKSDLIAARQEVEQHERANRGKPAQRKRLKWDEAGWFREEVAMVTAYCPCAKCCGTHSPGITSIGSNAWTPGLAADPLYLDYGTRVLIPGYGLSMVDDTGGAMRRHWREDGILHIDVRMTYHYEARQWGKQYLRVKIYDEN